MSADSQWALQTAIFTALSADAGVKALIGDPARIFDHVPPESVFPYLVIGEATSTPFDAKTQDGMEQTLTLHAWSRYRGLKEIKDIMAAVSNALDQQALNLTGHTLVLLRFDFGATFLDSDGLTRHGVQRFGAITQAS
jgi:Protein of unknown function (DUF3168)